MAMSAHVAFILDSEFKVLNTEKFSPSEKSSNVCPKRIWTACWHTRIDWRSIMRGTKDFPLKANHCVLRMSLKKTDLGKLSDSADSSQHSVVHCLPERRGERKCTLSLPLRHSSTSLYPSGSVNNAVDFITIPSTSSFTQELLWSDIPRTQFLHKALLLLHWMATNLWQNTKSGQQGITDRERPQGLWVQLGYLAGEKNKAQSG